MEQIQQLLDILKSTPEMAIWALIIYFIFILLKLASWVYSLKVILQLFIKRYFDYKENKITKGKGAEIAAMFEKEKISNVDYSLLIELLQSVKENSNYIHESDLKKAIKKLKQD